MGKRAFGWSYDGQVDRQAVSTIAALDDDVRARLFECVRTAASPVTREMAAQSVGISRKLAAFHLDKLVVAGLLTSRIEAVGAPRVGRTPKVYELSGNDVSVAVPQRELGVLADVLVDAVLTERADERAEQSVLRVAKDRGRSIGTAERERVRPGRVGAERALGLAATVLERYGFEPVRETDTVRLRNCPFHPLAVRAPDLVCALNHCFLGGVVEGLDADGVLEARLEPEPGHCCVVLHRR